MLVSSTPPQVISLSKIALSVKDQSILVKRTLESAVLFVTMFWAKVLTAELQDSITKVETLVTPAIVIVVIDGWFFNVKFVIVAGKVKVSKLPPSANDTAVIEVPVA